LSTRDLFEEEQEDAPVDLVASLIDRADRVYVKKLALNDWQWSEDPDKHQGGAYIPKEDRDSGFFPPLNLKKRPEGKPEIREVFVDISWSALGSKYSKLARLVNYRSKGEETHLTGVPAAAFSGLAPASFLLISRKDTREDPVFSALTIDSRSASYDYLIDLFEIGPDFVSGLFEPVKILKTFQERLFEFIGRALDAYRTGRIDTFAASHSIMPKPKDLALLARTQYQAGSGIDDFNPFSLQAPGDVIREISRGTEYELFREFEIRRRSMELVQLILGNDLTAMSVEQALINIITEFPKIDRILLSAAQTRKSRAGTSFENHIEKMLADGGIPHEVQVVIEAKKRPDFILPSFELYTATKRPRVDALVLSAKTTLRERWKQVHSEIRNCDLYLATVDENIAGNAIEDMEQQGIRLVVPESLKNSDITAYRKQSNVISFKDFFENDIRKIRFPLWVARGIM
jgi:hypothetical protein